MSLCQLLQFSIILETTAILILFLLIIIKSDSCDHL